MVTPLKAERLRRGITAEELATAVGVLQPAITRIENGQRGCGRALAIRLVKFFDGTLTRDQILYPEEHMVEENTSPKKPIPQRLRKAS